MNTNTGAPAAHSLEVLRVLQAARALVAKGWTQGVTARDATGAPIGTNDGAAIAWCSSGAMHAVGGCVACPFFEEVVGHEIIDWNDEHGRTQADVLAAFDKAIAIAQGNAPKAPTEEIL